MGGADPYSASKGCAEIVVVLSCKRAALGPEGADIAIASVRSGNVVGGGDWSSDRLVPDCIRSFIAGAPVKLRNPEAVRPWLHVLEPLAGYMLLAERLVDANSTDMRQHSISGPAPIMMRTCCKSRKRSRNCGEIKRASKLSAGRTRPKRQRFAWMQRRLLSFWIGGRVGISRRRSNGRSSGTKSGMQGVTCGRSWRGSSLISATAGK